MALRIMLVDDHQIFREALRSLLEKTSNIHVVGEAGDGQLALKLAEELSPDIVCLDIGMPGINGVETARTFSIRFPKIRIIALSTHTDRVYVMDMLKAGVSAYVTKAEGGKELLRAIEAVANNRQYLCPGISDATVGILLNKSAGAATAVLSEREQQILRLVASGMSSQEIALNLSIAAGTVDVHRRNIMRKLDLHSAVELTRYAFNTGMVDD